MTLESYRNFVAIVDCGSILAASKQLLIAYKYDFNFPENYILKYLNNIVLKLDNDLINRSIGSDIIGR